MLYLTYKLKRVFRVDISQQQTDETQVCHLAEFLPDRDCESAVTIRPAKNINFIIISSSLI